MPRLLFVVLFAACFVSACGSSATKTARTYAAGDKATAGPLIYNVVDVHILPRLGDDPTTARTPENRFFLVKVSASNSSANEVSIPALTLIDDHGKAWPEVSDGTNVPDWIGVLRRVDPGQTDSGVVVFDAPAQHYRLRLTDETEEDVGIDIPLTFLNENATQDLPTPDAVPPIQLPKNKQ
jgi:hypothetical protein